MYYDFISLCIITAIVGLHVHAYTISTPIPMNYEKPYFACKPTGMIRAYKSITRSYVLSGRADKIFSNNTGTSKVCCWLSQAVAQGNFSWAK